MEIAKFLLFPQCFQTSSAAFASKRDCKWENVKPFNGTRHELALLNSIGLMSVCISAQTDQSLHKLTEVCNTLMTVIFVQYTSCLHRVWIYNVHKVPHAPKTCQADILSCKHEFVIRGSNHVDKKYHNDALLPGCQNIFAPRQLSWHRKYFKSMSRRLKVRFDG